jgi:hypothetical protein
MSEINPKDYEFESYLLDNIKLFDEVLEECGELPLLENKHFSPFLDFLITTRHLVVELNTLKPNVLPIVIWFEAEDLRIDIDQMNETFDWSRKQIQETRDKVIELIKNLLTGYVSIETRSSSRFVQIFDAEGFFVQELSYNNLFHMFTGLYLSRHKNFRRLYLPIFSKKK